MFYLLQSPHNTCSESSLCDILAFSNIHFKASPAFTHHPIPKLLSHLIATAPFPTTNVLPYVVCGLNRILESMGTPRLGDHV